jgi:hypothetical protein
MNRRTAEQGTAEYRSENIFLFFTKTSAVRNSLFDIVLRTPHPAGGSPVSIFKIQNRLNPASMRARRFGTI